MVQDPEEIDVILPAVLAGEPEHAQQEHERTAVACEAAFPHLEYFQESLPGTEEIARLVEQAVPQAGSHQGSEEKRVEEWVEYLLVEVFLHYGKTVSFRDEEAKGMKFIMTWDPDMPLSDFIDGLNLFDGLSLTLQHDTIFVETAEDKVSM